MQLYLGVGGVLDRDDGIAALYGLLILIEQRVSVFAVVLAGIVPDHIKLQPLEIQALRRLDRSHLAFAVFLLVRPTSDVANRSLDGIPVLTDLCVVNDELFGQLRLDPGRVIPVRRIGIQHFRIDRDFGVEGGRGGVASEFLSRRRIESYLAALVADEVEIAAVVYPQAAKVLRKSGAAE